MGLSVERPSGTRAWPFGDLPKVPSAGAGSTLGYSRFLPPGGMAPRLFGSTDSLRRRSVVSHAKLRNSFLFDDPALAVLDEADQQGHIVAR